MKQTLLVGLGGAVGSLIRMSAALDAFQASAGGCAVAGLMEDI